VKARTLTVVSVDRDIGTITLTGYGVPTIQRVAPTPALSSSKHREHAAQEIIRFAMTYDGRSQTLVNTSQIAQLIPVTLMGYEENHKAPDHPKRGPCRAVTPDLRAPQVCRPSWPRPRN
jgi:hypothetical protein